MGRDWVALYGATIESLPRLAARAPLTLCGSGACIDARISLHDIGPMLDAHAPEAAEFARMLQSRAARGQGGEFASDWTAGPEWIARNLPVSYAMGGTGPHAAATISAAGAPALLALADRSAQMLSLAHPDILLAEGDRIIRAAEATSRGATRPPVHIFEYTAGEAVGAVVPTRSSRIIVRFSNFLLEDDIDFARASLARISEAGAGLVSGFSSIPAADLPREVARVAALARAWRAGGLATVHLELAGYDSMDLLHATVAELQDAITSIGMSHSELGMIAGDDADPLPGMRHLAERLALDRVCVHADHWAASVTKRDPESELQALVMGCLLAAARASTGRPMRPDRLDEATTFASPPFAWTRSAGGWTFVACPSAYLRAPRTTLGLGDTFTGGCLLALGAGGGATAFAAA